MKLSGIISKNGICRKYSLSDYSLLHSLIRIFAPDSLIKEPIIRDKDEQQKEIEHLKTLLATKPSGYPVSQLWGCLV